MACNGPLSNRKLRHPKTFLFIVLGAHDWSKNESTTQIFGIDKMVVNRRFLTDKAYGYDIALIKLSRPAVLNFAVGLACLPKQDDRVPVGTKCYITGKKNCSGNHCYRRLFLY